MAEKKRDKKSEQLRGTLQNLERAVSDWEQLSKNPEYELDDQTKKTRQLLKKLTRQIHDLGF